MTKHASRDIKIYNKDSLAVGKPSWFLKKSDLVVLDGCALLLVGNWPLAGNVLDLENNVANFLHKKIGL